jgi:acyl-CoA reductase-like NAD-dependent aldehyde dehydrogenase
MAKTTTKKNGAGAVRTKPRIAPQRDNGTNGNGSGRHDDARDATTTQRLPVLKTYKVYIGGKFPRTESGRYYLLKDSRGEPIANVCQCSRKDFRDSVVAARAAFGGWARRSAYNRAQILYRIAEMLEGRAAQFVAELTTLGLPASAGMKEVQTSIDRVLYYAGWADKFQQVFSSVNPVSSSHFNFSLLEPTGVVSIIAPEQSPLLGLLSVIAPTIAGGNACIALASSSKPLSAVTLAEVLATSDLPGGVVNLLTGHRSELVDQFASHMDVNATIYCGNDPQDLATVRTKAANNVKRVVIHDRPDWTSDQAQSPYFILDTQEVKTTWHPVGV